MGIRTNVYLRKKDNRLLKFSHYPDHYPDSRQSPEEITAVHNQDDDYNRKVAQTCGCILFFLGKTPSIELDELQGTAEPLPLTKELLERILTHYDQKIEYRKELIRGENDKIEKLEARIVKANVQLYDKISSEINDCQSRIFDFEYEMGEFKLYRSRFAFVKDMMENPFFNTELYELVYTKF